MEAFHLEQSTVEECFRHVPGRQEWEQIYPTVRDKVFADINQCPPHLRHHFEALLLDSSFEIPTKPYLYQQHMNFLENLKKTSPNEYHKLCERYVFDGPGGHYFEPNRSKFPARPCDPNKIMSSKPIASLTNKAVRIHTSRPELLSNAPTVSYKKHESLKRSASSLNKDDCPTTMSGIIAVLKKCKEFITFERSLVNQLIESGFVTEKNQALLHLEACLLNLATFPDCTDSVFYSICFVSNDKILYVRFMESGACEGFFKEKIKAFILSHCPDISDTISWQVYNASDLGRPQRDPVLPNKVVKAHQNVVVRPRPDKVYMRNLKGAKQSVTKSAGIFERIDPDSEAKMKYIGMLLHVKRKGYQHTVGAPPSDKWFIRCSHEFEARCQPFQDMVCTNTLTESATTHVPFKEYVDSMCTLSNPSLGEQEYFINQISNLDDNCLHDKEKRFITKFSVSHRPPMTPRNRVLWSQLPSNANARFQHLRKVFASYIDPTDPMESTDNCYGNSDEVRESPRRIPVKERVATLLRSFHSNERNTSLDIVSVENMAVDGMKLYQNYKLEFVHSGTVSWRVHDALKDVILINDIDDDKGTLKPTRYVHCSRSRSETGFTYSCGCKSFHTLMEQDDGHPSDFIHCIHCRILDDHLSDALSPNESNLQIVRKLKKAYHDHSKSIILVPAMNNTVKFSVVHEGIACFVHLHQQQSTGKFVIRCQAASCSVKFGSKKAITSLTKSESLCPHLELIRSNPRSWNEFVHQPGVSELSQACADPEDESEDEQDDILNDGPPAAGLGPADPQDDSTFIETDGVFDEEMGLWKFKCVSTHSARAFDDPILQACVRTRSYSDRDPLCTPRYHGMLLGPSFVPPFPASNVCGCTYGNSGWKNEEYNEGRTAFVRVMTMYTTTAPVRCCVFKRLCVNGECHIDWDEGAADCLHVSTPLTCAGDEIAHSYIQLAISGKQSFTSFCEFMNQTYQHTYTDARFMSPYVFRKWLISWASNQKIEFRQQCKVCGQSPQMLACDGTEIGITFKNLKVKKIESPDDPNTVLETLHRRNDRCFLAYNSEIGNNEEVRLARQNLLCMSEEVIKFREGNDQQSWDSKVASVIAVLPEDALPSFHRFSNLDSMSRQERLALAYVYKQLATTAPLSAFLPFSAVDLVQSLLDHLNGVVIQENPGIFFNSSMQKLRHYRDTLRSLLAASMANNDAPKPHVDICQLVQYIILKVRMSPCEEPEMAVPQPGSYNPAKFGRAYYFRPDGKRVRNVRKFSMDVPGSERIHDDRPANFEVCDKVFPSTSRRGTSHLFLWFCPLHGHCYGFHIIPKAEGRKDPCHSLVSHLETPPQVVFYDFACSLHEYCLNRESGYYNQVRFFHDIFHSYTHKCSSAYKSSQLQGFEAVNSEICEQFNSFMQHIKYVVRQMSQIHFVFYLQFFINIWNQRKLRNFEKRLVIALAGLE